MTYSETLDYLYARLPMFSRSGPAALKPDLGNTLALCAAKGNPQQGFRSIHIAGTNGKGSCSHMLAAVLQESGYRTGLYTSPHLIDFRERIRIDGKPIPEEAVVAFTASVCNAIEDIQPSFFELTVCMAFDWFASERVDIAVIETGLGGRLDSTNIIRPELAVITQVGRDHMPLLGTTLSEIAAEKAGIIKAGVPLVVGETHPETAPVFSRAAEDAATSISFADAHWSAVPLAGPPGLLQVALLHRRTEQVREIRLDLPGQYQIKNLVTVAESVHQLASLGFQIPPECFRSALEKVRRSTGLRGRWELVRQEPFVFLDVAHNEDGMRALLSQPELHQGRPLHIVIGMVRDKDPGSVLNLLPPKATYYFCQAAIPRALPASDLRQLAGTMQLDGQAFGSVATALQAALSGARPNDLVLVCGSVFVVGEALLSLEHAPDANTPAHNRS